MEINRKHIGAKTELEACAWLLAQGYEVFRNVSPFGLGDLIVWKNGTSILIDVKTGSYIPLATEEQLKYKVKFLIKNDNSEFILVDSFISKKIKQCSFCLADFNVNHRRQKFCSASCRHKHWLKATG